MEYKVGDMVRVKDGGYGSRLKGQVGEIVTVPARQSDLYYIQLHDDLHPSSLPFYASEIHGLVEEGSRDSIEDLEDIQLHTPDTEYIPDGSGSILTIHPTGAQRESKEGKGRPDLLLAGFPRAVMAVCRHVDCDLGRERNWEKGLPESSLISSQFRHLLGYTSGVSEDTPLYNLTANAWNALVLLEEYMRVQDGVMVEDVLDIEKEVEA